MIARVRRLRGWMRAHPMAGDGLLALGLAIFVVASMAEGTSRGPMALVVFMYALMWVPLLWRRTHPAAATGAVVAGHLLNLALVPEMTPAVVTAPVMLYAVARYEDRRLWSRVYLVVALLGSVAAGVDWAFFGPWRPPEAVSYAIWSAGTCAIVATSSWGFGLLARQRAQSITQLRERAEALERERDQHARLAAEEERTRIARDMHDVVAHSLSVIVVQADGAAYGVEHGADPEAARRLAVEALATIGGTAREALADTRRLVAVLRGGDEAEFGVGAGLDDVDELLAPLRAAGRQVDLVVTGRSQALPRDVDLAAFRVVQESLTNVIKHAGTLARARVEIDHAERVLRIRVTDDGRGALGSGADSADGRGHGLIGMRERVAACGGTLEAGRLAGHGFRVAATIPTETVPPLADRLADPLAAPAARRAAGRAASFDPRHPVEGLS